MTNELVVYDPNRVALSVSPTPLPSQGLLARARRRLAIKGSIEPSGRRAIATGNHLGRDARPTRPLHGLVKPLRVVLPTALRAELVPPTGSRQARTIVEKGSRRASGPEQGRRVRMVVEKGSRPARTINKMDSRQTGQTGWLAGLFGIGGKKIRTVQVEPEPQTVSQPSLLNRLDNLFASSFGPQRTLVPVAVPATANPRSLVRVNQRTARPERVIREARGRSAGSGNKGKGRLVRLTSVSPSGEQSGQRVVQRTGRQERRTRSAPVAVQVVKREQKKTNLWQRVSGAVGRVFGPRQPERTQRVGRGGLNRRDFLRLSGMAGVGAALAACAPKTVVVKEKKPPTETPKPDDDKVVKEATATVVGEVTKEVVATSIPEKPTATPTPEDPGERATRIAETKIGAWPKIEWINEETETLLTYFEKERQRNIFDQAEALRGCAEKWVSAGTIGVDQNGIASGVRLRRLDRGVSSDLVVLEVTEGYEKGTLLLALDNKRSVEENTLVPVSFGDVLAQKTEDRPDPTFITPDLDGLVPEGMTIRFVWSQEKNTLVAESDGLEIAVINPWHVPEDKIFNPVDKAPDEAVPGWELIPTTTPKPVEPTATQKPAATATSEPKEATATPKPPEPEATATPEAVVEHDTVVANYFSGPAWDNKPDRIVTGGGSSVRVVGSESNTTFFEGSFTPVNGDIDISFEVVVDPDGNIAFRNKAGDVFTIQLFGGELYFSDSGSSDLGKGGSLPGDGGLRVLFEGAGSTAFETITVFDKDDKVVYRRQLSFDLFSPGGELQIDITAVGSLSSVEINNLEIKTRKNQ